MMAGSNLSIALIHAPVYNKRGDVITTSVTNIDLHDIARTARTFGLANYFIVTPVVSQHELMGRIARHWTDGWGSTYNPNRQEAFQALRMVHTLEDAKAACRVEGGGKLVTVVTSANPARTTVNYTNFGAEVARNPENHYLVLFGTGWGLTAETMDSADHILPPILGNGDYNHLSVRSAVAIIMDRIFNHAKTL